MLLRTRSLSAEEEPLHTAREDLVANYFVCGPVCLQSLKSIHDVYAKHLALPDLKQVLAHVRTLDADGFLEEVLWPHAALATAPTNASSKTSAADRQQQKTWVLSVVILVNFKFRESAANVWGFLSSGGDDKDWEAFVATLLSFKHGASAVEWSVLEKSYLVQFLINCYQSLEVPVIAKVPFVRISSVLLVLSLC